jgi:D-glycerate 3-kinase
MSIEQWLLAQCQAALACGQKMVIGLNGPIGAGKTTLSLALHRQFSEAGVQLAVVSIDDAYLPWEQRLAAMAGNPFGVTRVPPGSHDPGLLQARITAWRSGDQPLVLPRFDKTLRGGHGDRCDDERVVADALLLEGWLVGCRSLGEVPEHPCLGQLSRAEREWLPHWDAQLQSYEPLWEQLDRLVQLWPDRWSSPRRWRFQAEARQRRRGGGWLPAAALDAVVRSSLCSLPAPLYQQPLLARADWVRVLDGRRRYLWEGSGDDAMGRWAQASSPSSSATG